MCEADENVIRGLIRDDVERIEKIHSKPVISLMDRATVARIRLHKAGLNSALDAITTRRVNGKRTAATGRRL